MLEVVASCLRAVEREREDGTDWLPGSGGVVPSPAQLLPRGQHHQHDLRLGGRQGLLCPHPQPEAGLDRLGDSEEKQLIPVSGPDLITKA